MEEWSKLCISFLTLTYKLSSVFLILVILTGVRQYLRVIQIFISLVASDLKQSLKCLSAIWDCSVKTEGIIKTELIRKWSGTTNVNISKRTHEMEERLSRAEDTIKKIDSLVKENIKSTKSCIQNIREIWDTIKKTKPKNNRDKRSITPKHRKHIQQNHKRKLS